RLAALCQPVPACANLCRVILRDMTEQDLDVLFEMQDDEVARHMAAFTSPDAGERERYLEKWRAILADATTTNKVIVLDGEVVGSIGAFVVDQGSEVTYWVRR